VKPYVDNTAPGTVVPERRAPVQREDYRRLPDGTLDRAQRKPAGSISWDEHLEAYAPYSRRYGTDQSAERLAERGGFGYWELFDLLGHEPTTWKPR
jgi:hypothetical protein